jgi:hypothetical protein
MKKIVERMEKQIGDIEKTYLNIIADRDATIARQAALIQNKDSYVRKLKREVDLYQRKLYAANIAINKDSTE